MSVRVFAPQGRKYVSCVHSTPDEIIKEACFWLFWTEIKMRQDLCNPLNLLEITVWSCFFLLRVGLTPLLWRYTQNSACNVAELKPPSSRRQVEKLVWSQSLLVPPSSPSQTPVSVAGYVRHCVHGRRTIHFTLQRTAALKLRDAKSVVWVFGAFPPLCLVCVWAKIKDLIEGCF